MNEPFSIVITGPTASGKTAVAAALARLLGSSIISADSRQVYRYLDIGTNKTGTIDPASGLRITAGVPQHLTDIIDPCETFSAGEFARRAGEIIARLHADGIVPVIAGGTGLYIKALIDGLVDLPGRDEDVRAELNAERERSGLDSLFEELRRVDPEYAAKSRGNTQRIIRALEIFRLTGLPLSAWHRTSPPRSGQRFAQFGLSVPREELNRIINKRSAAMIAGGMLEETDRVLARGFSKDCPGLQGIGYRSLIRCREGALTLEDAERELAAETRQYAKRQMTWFRRDLRITWLEASLASFEPEQIARRIFQTISNML